LAFDPVVPLSHFHPRYHQEWTHGGQQIWDHPVQLILNELLNVRFLKHEILSVQLAEDSKYALHGLLGRRCNFGDNHGGLLTTSTMARIRRSSEFLLSSFRHQECAALE
jgi:hypothetical protein